jgi:Xaa-Pro aminopeptidase
MLVQEKINQAKEILREFDVDCWITFVRESEINGDPILDFFLESQVTWHSAIVITRAGEAHAIVGRYDKQAIEDTGAYQTVTGYVQGIGEPLTELLEKLQPSRIAINYSRDSEICDGLTHGMYLTLCDLLAPIGLEDRLTSAEQLVSALRQRKTASELDCIREAIRFTEGVFREVAAIIRPGVTEKEIATFMKERVEAARLELAWDEKACPAVFTGPDTAEAHYGPTDRKVEPGHVLNMDFGVKWNGYCSDLQRTFYIAAPGETEPPPEVQKGFRTIVGAIESSRQTLRPGARGVDVDKVARDTVIAAGYEEYPHGLGHQVGRFAHDGTALLGPAWEKYARKPFVPIERGMVFTLEPRVTVPGRGVVTIEEMVVVTDAGAQFLSTPQREPLVIRRSPA